MIVGGLFALFPGVLSLVRGDWPNAIYTGGVGLALMAQCERDHDADRIFISTNKSNAPMRRLLDKAGWRPSGQIDNLDPGDPELVFVKFRG